MELLTRSTECHSRNDIPKMLERMGLTGEGAEIGVREGIYAKSILTGWPSCKKLHLIDPWCELPKDEYKDERAFDPAWEGRCQRRMEEFKDRVLFHKKRSLDACPDFEFKSLDFVYIDANHSREHVLADLNFWAPKVQDHGVIAGHDIFSLAYPGVTQAVLTFAADRQLTVHLVRGDFNKDGKQIYAASWYILKGER